MLRMITMEDLSEMLDYEIDPEIEDKIHKINNEIAKLPDEHVTIIVGHTNMQWT